MKRAGIRKWAIRTSAAVAVVLALPLLYLIGALIGSVVPANWGWQPPERGITIFVQSNGVHTWIAVPKLSADMDWRPILPAEHIRNPALAGDYAAIGYGNRDFYLNTPTWSDLTVGRALGAAFARGGSLVHVYHLANPQPAEDQRPIVLDRAQYRRLTDFLLASFERDRSGQVIPLIGRGYGGDDIFYEARGGYNLFYTCNQWTGSALRAAGVRVGLWTPFAKSIMARF